MRVCSGGITQDHEQFVRTCGDEVVTGGESTQDDTLHTVAAPLVGTTFDVVVHGDGTGEVT